MNNVHSIIFAYHMNPELGELCKFRTPSALPFCARYRLVDLPLSGLMHAGLYNVDVVMQFGYGPLLDHLTGGRPWNMARLTGGLRQILAKPELGRFGGSMAALSTMHEWLRNDIKAEHILMTRGDLCANIDMGELVEKHMESGADVTVVCTSRRVPGEQHHFVPGEGGFARELLCQQTENDRGVTSLETYIMKREKLLELMQWCVEGNRLHFHRDGLMHMMRDEGWRVGLYMHEGYSRFIYDVKDYYDANMDMLIQDNFLSVFRLEDERRVATRARSDVSSYYSDTAQVKDSLVADGCQIEGKVTRCVLSRGVRVEPGCDLQDCVILDNTTVGAGTVLKHVVSDKEVVFSPNLSLAGSAKLPLVIPKRAKL